MALGMSDILLIGVFILLVFGSKRIPELARSLGRASHEFKKAKAEISKQGDELLNAAERVAEKKDQQEKAENAAGNQ